MSLSRFERQQLNTAQQPFGGFNAIRTIKTTMEGQPLDWSFLLCWDTSLCHEG